MTFARLALESDEDAVVAIARMQVAETLPHLEFSEDITRATFRRYLETSQPTIFVAEDRRKVIGYLVAMTFGYAMATGLFAAQEVIYVVPERRGTRAAAHLLDIFNSWADRIGAIEVFAGVSNGYKVDRTSRFMQHFGFAPVGVNLRRINGEH